MTTLERRYRRLLWAYPMPWRRRHGTEMVTTLLEMSVPGQRRPAVADAWDLLRGGVRERFRVPARRRPVMVFVAVLCAVIGGAFGAAAGSFAGERTFEPLPGDAGLFALSQDVAGAPGAPSSGGRGSSPWWAVRANANTDAPIAEWDVEAAQRRLADDGWVTRPVDAFDGVDPWGRYVKGWMVLADRDGLSMSVTVNSTGGATFSSVSLWQKSTPVFRPLLIGGTILGLLAGWLIGAAVLRRTASGSAGMRRATVVLLTGSVLVLAIPVAALYRNLWRAMGDQVLRDGPPFTVHSALTFSGGNYYPIETVGVIPVLAATGLLIGAVAVTVALLTRPSPGTTSGPAQVNAG